MVAVHKGVLMNRLLPLVLVLAAGCGNNAKKPAPSPDMAPMCPTPVAADPMAAMRDSCSFAAGALPTDTLGVSAAQQKTLPIKHIIVLMKENRSFDHLFGQLSTQGQPDAEPVPANFSNPDSTGTAVPRFHLTTTCVHNDPPHQWDNMHAIVDGGKMDGAVTNGTMSTPASDGHFTMGYYDSSDIPFYYWLASTFALADHHFTSVRSGTWANRDYLVAATSHGTKNTASDPQLSGVPLIFDELDTAKVTWQVYTDDLAPLEYSVSWTGRKGQQSVATFFSKLADGSLESVAFVDANAVLPPETDEHPPDSSANSDLQVGEAWSATLINNVIKSPLWPSTALIYTYDEGGGFHDHVAPGNSCAPSPDQAEFTELGMRVPLVVVSPYARPHYVSHVVHQHTSITRLIELLFNVPALTARDANSDALLDLFDFNCPALLKPPTPPAAGTGKCN
jgi:phospholipase C